MASPRRPCQGRSSLDLSTALSRACLWCESKLCVPWLRATWSKQLRSQELTCSRSSRPPLTFAACGRLSKSSFVKTRRRLGADGCGDCLACWDGEACADGSGVVCEAGIGCWDWGGVWSGDCASARDAAEAVRTRVNNTYVARMGSSGRGIRKLANAKVGGDGTDVPKRPIS